MASPLSFFTAPFYSAVMKSGKAVSLQAGSASRSPAHCSSNKYLLKKAGCSCNALRVAIARLSCCLQFTSPPFGQLLCPFSQLHSIANSFVSLHLVRPWQFAEGLGIPAAMFVILNEVKDLRRMHNPFRKPSLHSPGFISLPRRLFISAGFSPPAAFFYFARR